MSSMLSRSLGVRVSHNVGLGIELEVSVLIIGFVELPFRGLVDLLLKNNSSSPVISEETDGTGASREFFFLFFPLCGCSPSSSSPPWCSKYAARVCRLLLLFLEFLNFNRDKHRERPFLYRKLPLQILYIIFGYLQGICKEYVCKSLGKWASVAA